MDPITAWAQATKAIAELLTEIVRGMSTEQKQKVWDWWIEDQTRLRKVFHIGD